MNYAPVLIPTLNRYEHFKRCVDTLARCTGADKTDLFIALDYPAKPEHFEGHNRISIFVDGIRGFRDVKIIRRSVNYGVSKNLRTAREEIKKHYHTYIYTDDDNEFSPNFLDFINKGLEKFKDDPRIIAICGHGGKYKNPSDYTANYLYRKGFSAWGFGTWFDRGYKVDYNTADMRDFVADPELRKRLKYYYERHYYSTLSYITRGATMRGDGAIALDLIKNDTYCVYPTVSKVRNHGHDGSGEHGGNLKDSPYSKVVLDQNPVFEYEGDPDFDDPRYLAILRSRTRVTPKQKLKFWLRASQNPKKMLDLWKLVH